MHDDDLTVMNVTITIPLNHGYVVIHIDVSSFSAVGNATL